MAQRSSRNRGKSRSTQKLAETSGGAGRSRQAGGAAAALAGSLLVLAAPALAQPGPDSPASPYTSAGPVAAGPLSGYTGMYATPVPPRSAVGSYRHSGLA